MKFVMNERDFIQSKKFKNINILIALSNVNDENKLWHYRYITEILNRGCEKYPTKKALINKLFSLYGANVSISSSSVYKTATLNLSIDIVNPIYVGEDNLLKDAIDVAKEMLFKPLLNNDKTGFDEKVFDEVRRLYIDHIKNIKTNKRRYALAKLLEYTKKEDDFPFDNSLDLDSFEKITNEELYSFYKEILKNSKVMVKGIGDFDSIKVKEYIDSLELNTNEVVLESFSNKNTIIEKVNKIVDVEDLNQAKLNMSYRSNIKYSDKLYPAYILFNEMFGGMFNSSLFSNIREKRGLCYTIRSAIRTDQLFLVTAGIDNCNDDITIDLIKEELANYQNGKIENGEELLKEAVDVIELDYNDSKDSTYKLLTKEFSASLPGRRTMEELLEKCKTVTLNDIIEVSKNLTLDTIYVLKGENKNE